MIKILEDKFLELESRTEHLISLTSSFSTEQLQRPENQDAWSVIQVFQHVLFSESGTLGYIMKKSSGGWDMLETEGQQERENAMKLVQRLASNERYKAPDVLPAPPNNESLEQIVERWKELRGKWKTFLEVFEEQHLDKLVFRQPAAGMITMDATMDFLLHHLVHHEPQINRILSSIK